MKAEINPHKKPTLEHIATIAGVSKATVSRVLNGSPKVKEDVVKRVDEGAVALMEEFQVDVDKTNSSNRENFRYHFQSIGSRNDIGYSLNKQNFA